MTTALRSLINIASPWRGVLPVPDGTTDQGDMQTVMHMATSPVAGEASPEPEVQFDSHDPGLHRKWMEKHRRRRRVLDEQIRDAELVRDDLHAQIKAALTPPAAEVITSALSTESAASQDAPLATAEPAAARRILRAREPIRVRPVIDLAPLELRLAQVEAEIQQRHARRAAMERADEEAVAHFIEQEDAVSSALIAEIEALIPKLRRKPRS